MAALVGVRTGLEQRHGWRDNAWRGPAAVAVHACVTRQPSFPATTVRNLPPGLNLYNPYAVLDYLKTQAPNADYAPNPGYPMYAGGNPTPALSPGSVQHVDRKNYAPFVAAAHDFALGDMTLKTNVGFRYQKTNVQIAGLSAPLTGLGVLPGDLTAYAFQLGPSTYTTASNSYGYFLPSLDLNLLVRPNLKVRVDYSRTESPPNNAQLIPNTTYNGRVNALTAQGNNPELLPYLSQNFDLGAEWYYAIERLRIGRRLLQARHAIPGLDRAEHYRAGRDRYERPLAEQG